MVQGLPGPRDRPAELSLDNYVHEHGYAVPWSRYGAEPWSLEPPRSGRADAEDRVSAGCRWPSSSARSPCTGSRPGSTRRS